MESRKQYGSPEFVEGCLADKRRCLRSPAARQAQGYGVVQPKVIIFQKQTPAKPCKFTRKSRSSKDKHFISREAAKPQRDLLRTFAASRETIPADIPTDEQDHRQTPQKTVQVHTRFTVILTGHSDAVGHAPLSFQDSYRCQEQLLQKHSYIARVTLLESAE